MPVAEQLLRTKLYIPRQRASLVARPRLIEQLAQGLHAGHTLTLVSAPAGFGKTTLLLNLNSQISNLKMTWLSLDEGDNDPARFLTYLVAALNAIRADVGETVLGLLQAPQPPPPQTILTALINDLATLSAPFALVLDDYHVITRQPIHEAMTLLIDHLPAQMHLVILTRADPPLPLARLRARNQLTEIRAADLRFTSDEAAAFLNQVMGLNLSANDIAALETRTEGWIAGLQLAALAMQGTLSMQDRQDVRDFVAEFTGGHHYIVDYLVEEVLSRQPDPVREFLMQTSILDRMTGPLCDALTGRTDGQATLEKLERSNLFVSALDDERRWYRYHHLFADVLRSHLRQAQPALVPELHRRAAEWHEHNGWVAQALNHTLAAGDQERAARLVEQNAMSMLMRGELMTLLNWIEAIESQSRDRPWLYVYQAWTYTLIKRLERVEPMLLEAERHVSSDVPAAEAEVMLGHVFAIRAYMAGLRGDARHSIEWARRAQEHLPEGNLAVRSVVALTLGNVCALSGDLAGARRAFAEAGRAGQAVGNLNVAVGGLSALAQLLIEQGQLFQAVETYHQSLQLATLPNGRLLPVGASAHVGLSLVSYEWNDLPAASHHANQIIELGQKWGNVDNLTAGYIMQARTRRAQGDPDGAQAAMQEVARLTRTQSSAPRFGSWVEAWRVRAWLAENNLEAAARWARDSGLTNGDQDLYPRYYEYLVLARLSLAQHDPEAALSLLERLLQSAEAGGRTGHVIEILILWALASQARDDIPQALLALERALALAEPEQYMRVFLDEGDSLANLLRHAGSRGIAPDYVTRLLSSMTGASGKPPGEQPLVEPLSKRERQVLRLIADGLSNQAIADKLVLSIGTIKAHTASIYGKLNVTGRTHAVARARELNLL